MKKNDNDKIKKSISKRRAPVGRDAVAKQYKSKKTTTKNRFYVFRTHFLR